MAYKTFSGSTFFSLDGVPFTISDKWKPPKKVTLPLKFENGNPSEVLFLEYNSTAEEELLSRFEAEREMEKAAAAVAAAAITPEPIDRASAKPANEVASGAVNCCPVSGLGSHLSHVEQKGSNLALQTRLVMQPSGAPNAKKSSTEIVLSQTNAAYHVMNGNILVPTQITASGESVLQGTDKTLHSFDLKDFENEQDPFENLSLKVINDIEELDKVFLASSRSQSDLDASSQDKKTRPAEVVDLRFHQQQGQQQQQEFLPDRLVHGNASGMFPPDGTSTVQQLQEKTSAETQVIASTQSAAVFYPSLPCSTALTANTTSSNTVPSDNSSTAWLPSVTQAYAARIPDSILTANLMSSVLQPKHNTVSSKTHEMSRLSFAVQTPGSIASSASKQTAFTDTSVSHGRLPPGPLWPLEASVSAWPPVIPLGYHPSPCQDSNHNRLEYDRYNMSYPSSKLPLRSAKSNPDLSAVDPSVGGSLGLNGRHTPPVFDTRSRPKPEGTDLSQACTTRNHTSLSDNLPHSENVSSRLEKVNEPSAEDNLFFCLSSEAQNFVDFITAMGFPKLQTIRAVEKLGIDEKLVLDHLCGFAKLMEKGYSAKDVENALFLFDGDLNKAEDYAKLAPNFRAMGFEEEKITTALVKCSLDGDKSLDWLTS